MSVTHITYKYLVMSSFLHRGKAQQMVDFLEEMLQSKDKFKAGATTLEVIRNHKKYISSKYSLQLSEMELEDLISTTGGAGDFRFDIKWKSKNKYGAETAIYVDTKNYGSAGSMFQDLGQFKAYISQIKTFDQLYIIQQGGRSVTREQVIAQLEKAIAKDAYGVFEANRQLWGSIGISKKEVLEQLAKNKKISTDPSYIMIRELIKITL